MRSGNGEFAELCRYGSYRRRTGQRIISIAFVFFVSENHPQNGGGLCLSPPALIAFHVDLRSMNVAMENAGITVEKALIWV
jgi:hypothetical protein